jgi:hypothetical protein
MYLIFIDPNSTPVLQCELWMKSHHSHYDQVWLLLRYGWKCHK